MQAYTGFARVYDSFMDNIPYEDWSEYLVKLLSEYGIEDGIILDLGCGTGNITQLLANRGFDMIGIDNAEEMLTIAIEKQDDLKDIEQSLEKSSCGSILYLLQDMREFELYGTVKAVVSICDSMNYIMSEEELLQVFQLVNNYLDPGGVFIFDMNTMHKYQDILGDTTIAENRDNCSFIWENYYYEEEEINEYDLTLYIKEESDNKEGGGNVFRRYEETHYQKAYQLETIIALIEKSGMEYVTAFDAFTQNPPRFDSERIYVVAREKRQESKYYAD